MDEIDNLMLAELEQESRLMRARNARLEAEVTVLTEMVRVLSDKLAQMEAKNDWKHCNHNFVNRNWFCYSYWFNNVLRDDELQRMRYAARVDANVL